MNAHRLRAPAVDGAWLAEPPLPDAAGLLAANAEALTRWDHDFQGKSAGWLRALVRRQAIEKAREYLGNAGLDIPAPAARSDHLIVTGHQPELFHPGVWVKNFAVAGLARSSGALGLNLIVDNDIPKASTIRVPQRLGGDLRVERIDFDDWQGEVPFEDLRVRDEARFASFGDRVRSVLAPEVSDPLLDDFWPRARECRGLTDRPGLRFAVARRALEASWGAHNLEVPLSALCETEGFFWFAGHVLAHLPRFQAVHNEALARYRELYGIRSKHHPVPALGRRGDWLEAPFWVWRAHEPRRRPLLVRQLPRTMLLRIDGDDEPLLELPLAPDREACCAVDQLMGLSGRRIRFRTRALTTTLFARFLLSDLFVHGIGGAKYDELGDEVARDFFGVGPPAFVTLSMTLWLGLRDDPARLDQLHVVHRALRDLSYNPDRRLDVSTLAPAEQEVIAAKRRALDAPQGTHGDRLARFREIRRCNEALQPRVLEARRRLEEDRTRLQAGIQRNAVARDREYALVLHSARRLHEAMTRVRAVAEGGSS